MRKMMNNAVYYSKRRRFVNQCLDKGMSLRATMQELRNRYTGFDEFGLTTLSRYAKKRRQDRINRAKKHAPRVSSRACSIGGLSLHEIYTLTQAQQLWLMFVRTTGYKPATTVKQATEEEHRRMNHESALSRTPLSPEGLNTCLAEQQEGITTPVRPVLPQEGGERHFIAKKSAPVACGTQTTEHTLIAAVEKARIDEAQARRNMNGDLQTLQAAKAAKLTLNKLEGELRRYRHIHQRVVKTKSDTLAEVYY